MDEPQEDPNAAVCARGRARWCARWRAQTGQPTPEGLAWAQEVLGVPPADPGRRVLIGGFVLAPSALLALALAAQRTIYGQALVDTAIGQNTVIAVPALALAEARAGMANSPEQQVVLVVLRMLPNVVLEILDGDKADDLGDWAGHTQHPVTGTLNAIRVALLRGWPLVTDDREDVLRMASPYSAQLEVISLP